MEIQQKISSFILHIIIFTTVLGDSSIYSQQLNTKKYVLRIGMPQTYFVNVDPEDAKVSMNTWYNLYTKKLKESHGIDLEAQVNLYENWELLDLELLNNNIDMINTPILDYFKLKNKVNFEPILTGSSGDSKFFQLVILVNKNSGIKHFNEILGKTLVIPENNLTGLMRIWINNVLNRKKLPELNSFFKGIKIVENEHRAVFSVFFGEQDCTIVKKSAFELSTELNPQIKSKLKAILISPEYVFNLAAIKKDFDPELKKHIIDLTTQFHLFHEEKQLLNIFKVTRVHKLDKNDLETTKKLFDENQNFDHFTLDEK